MLMQGLLKQNFFSYVTEVHKHKKKLELNSSSLTEASNTEIIDQSRNVTFASSWAEIQL